MATTSGVKQYTITINGVNQSITQVESLESTVDRLTGKIKEANAAGAASASANAAAARSSTQKKQALTEEEKAEQRLAATIDRVVRARTESNRAQIEANNAARAAQREVQREIQLREVGETSIRGMGLRLTDLRNEYELLSAEQREEIGVGDVLLQQIQALDTEYKALRESTGNFRDSVGNYPRALEGLNNLSVGLEQVNSLGRGISTTFGIANGVMNSFGVTSGEASETQQNLLRVISLVSVATQGYTEIIRRSSTAGLANTVIERVRLVQTRLRTRAEALATRGTIAATVAQRVFNAVANANPILLLIGAVLSLVGAYAIYTTTTDGASDSTEKYTSSLDGAAYSSKEARDAADRHIQALRDLDVQLALTTGKISQFQAALLNISNAQSAALTTLVNDTNEKLDEIEKDYDNHFKVLGRSFINFITGNDEGASLEALEQERLRRIQQVNEEFMTEQERQNEEYRKQREIEYAKSNNEVIRQNEDLSDSLLKGDAARIAQLNRQREREVEAARTRNEETKRLNQERASDQQLALIDITAIEQNYANQVQDIQQNAAKTAASERQKELEDRRKQTQENLTLIRRFEDQQAGLITNEFERRREIVRLTYERQQQDLENDLATRTNLSKEGEEAIRKMIVNIAEQRRRELAKIADDELKDLQDKENKRKAIIAQRISDNAAANREDVQNLETYKDLALAVIGEMEVRNPGGLQLLDVKETRKNIQLAKTVLNEYIDGVQDAYAKEEQLHQYNLLSLEYGSEEYEKELRRHASATLSLYNTLSTAMQALADLTKKEAELVNQKLMELTAKVSKAVEGVVTSMTAIFDTASLSFQYQIENMNEELEIINERYEEAQKLREESVENIKRLEEDLQEATGGTREAIREQLQDEMRARNEAQKEEERLQKEKEKQEAQIRKREKQAKRVEMLSNIAQGIGNTASGAARAFATYPFPYSAIVAAIVTAAGLAQVGIMTQQLSKLEDGGMINAPSHANGGARIQGTNIEVEGGEYVVNKRSTAANRSLIEYINRTENPISVADLVGITPGGDVPYVSVTDSETIEERLLEAIEDIELHPVVSVVDIIDQSNQVTEVRDIAGF